MGFSKIAAFFFSIICALFLVCGSSCSSDNSEGSNTSATSTERSQSEEIQNEVQLDDSEDPGTSLAAWTDDTGWVELYLFAETDNYNAAWNAAAHALGESTGMDITGSELKTEILDDKGLKEGIVTLAFDGSSVTGYSDTGDVMFSHKYVYIDKVADAIDDYDAYVYATTDENAGQYTYLCFTLPDIDQSVYHFYWRSCSDDYQSLFTNTYAGDTGAMVDRVQFSDDPNKYIRLLYGASTV